MDDSLDLGTRSIRRLASPLGSMKPHYDTIVVGSGYGGAIAASRLSRARRVDGSPPSICLLERGEELQPGEYPNTPAASMQAMQFDTPKAHLGRATALYDFRVNDELNVFVGCGLGGGSLVNANVSLEPDARVFADRAWPRALRDDLDSGLAEGFRRAREMLKPSTYPADRQTPAKLTALGQMGKGVSVAAQRPPINVHFGPAGPNHVGVVQFPCNDCGDCVSGCNVSAKNTLLMNYLPDAVNHGAQIFTCVSVRSIERDETNKRWIVRYRVLDAGVERFAAPESFVTAYRVFLGAGTLGSTEILLRSRARGLTLSNRLGHGFTGNGDVLTFAYNCDAKVHPVGYGALRPADDRIVGPCITGILDLRASAPRFETGMVIEEGSFPGALAPALPVLTASAAKLGSVPPLAQPTPEKLAREAESALLGPYHGAVDRTQVLLVMAHDDAGGRLVLEDDRLRIRWPGLTAQETFPRVLERLVAATEAVGGVLVKNPMWTELLGDRLTTVHALGGCGVGESAQSGVVDHAGRVFSHTVGNAVHDGLYVCDGAVMPRSLGVNPLLTISAMAERILALVAKTERWTIDYTLPSAPGATAQDAATRAAVGIQFTETMRGFVFSKGSDYGDAAKRGKEEGSRCEFTLTIRTDDLDALLADPHHRASLAGTVVCSMLSQVPLAASEGTFQLLPLDPSAPGTRRMRYSMTLAATDGATYRFSGFKTVHDDPGPDVWQDTTTLYVDIMRADGTAAAKGMLRIAPEDFLVQMTTLRTLHAENIATALGAKARFARFFAGAIADTYAGVARGAPRVWPPAKRDESPLRERRPLRLPAPEVDFFRTEDGVMLRLTRYRGGAKGPVMLAHGLGVSSRIFTVDTIDSCLAEFLVAHGYDTWLLDYRASVDLPTSRAQFGGDEIARFDYPAAVDRVCQLSDRNDVQIVAHCFGASTLFMALAAGLGNVRSAVFSQIAGHVSAPAANMVRAGLFMPDFLKLIGLDALTTDVSNNPGLLEQLYDKALALNPTIGAEQRCESKTCHRISFMYAPLYRHEQLNDATHEALGELFGIANLNSFQHLAAMIRARKVVAMEGVDVYLPPDPVKLATNLARFRFPIRFLHGELNECFLPQSTQRTLELLQQANPQMHYDRTVIPGYGHIDCIFGKDAAHDVYPHIVQHLEKTI